MPKWILISLAIGGYLGMWIIASWLWSRWLDIDEPLFTGSIGLLWPVELAALIAVSPALLVGYIVKHMPGNK